MGPLSGGFALGRVLKVGLGSMCGSVAHKGRSSLLQCLIHALSLAVRRLGAHVNVFMQVSILDSDVANIVQARAATACVQAGSDSPSCAANEQALVVQSQGQSCNVIAVAELVSAAYALAM